MTHLSSQPLNVASPAREGPPPRPSAPRGPVLSTASLTLQDGDLTLRLELATPSEAFTAAVLEGPCEFALVPIDGRVVVGFRFTGVVPWTPVLLEHQAGFSPTRPAPAAERRALLSIALVRGREILGRRNVTLSLEFTRALSSAVGDATRTSVGASAIPPHAARFAGGLPAPSDLPELASARSPGYP